MNKEEFINMLEQAKEDEYGRLYVLGKYNNKIYFGTITTICEDIFELNHSKENQDTAELYDRHFWNDDTLECFVVSTKHNENVEYKEPKRIKHIDTNNSIWEEQSRDIDYELKSKIDEIVDVLNKYECFIEKEI